MFLKFPRNSLNFDASSGVLEADQKPAEIEIPKDFLKVRALIIEACSK